MRYAIDHPGALASLRPKAFMELLLSHLDGA